MTVEPQEQLDSLMQRADKLLTELSTVYQRDLTAKSVSLDALNVTHEVVEKCSNALDQCMSAVFKAHIQPKLDDSKAPKGYFPAAADEMSYRASMGRWGVSKPEELIPDIDAKLRRLQPFTSAENNIYSRIRFLANQKHTGLVPQKKAEQRRVSVTGPSGGVSWGPGVTFGSGVSVMGVPIDPVTQMPSHSNGVDISVETWVSFRLADGGEDALLFCRQAIAATRRAIKVLLE